MGIIAAPYHCHCQEDRMVKHVLIWAVVGGVLSIIFNFPLLLGFLIGAILGTLISVRKEIVSEDKQNTSELKNFIREEQLEIKKDRVKVGEVKVHKEIVNDSKTITIPLKREELVIEAGTDQQVRIPLKEEEIKVEKFPVKINEVSITKRQIEEMKQVKEVVKKEKANLKILGKADVDVKRNK